MDDSQCMFEKEARSDATTTNLDNFVDPSRDPRINRTSTDSGLVIPESGRNNKSTEEGNLESRLKNLTPSILERMDENECFNRYE